MPGMDDQQHRRALVARAAQVLSQYPNVHSVGLGGRRRAGRPAGGGTVFKVFVSVKKRPQDLLPSETIPAQIDGSRRTLKNVLRPFRMKHRRSLCRARCRRCRRMKTATGRCAAGSGL